MIVVDSSAIVSMLLAEEEAQGFEDVLAKSDQTCMSAVNVYEIAVVLRRRKGASAMHVILPLLMRYRIEVVPFDEAQAKAAAAAYDRYGKGIDSKAKLNLADCAAYALAKSLDAPLLFEGRDFAATDIRSAH